MTWKGNNNPTASFYNKIFSLEIESERTEFAERLCTETFALIHLPLDQQPILSNLFRIFQPILNKESNFSQSYKCEFQDPYIGYVCTPNVKHSLWFHSTSDDHIFPAILPIKNESTEEIKDLCNLYRSENETKIVHCFNALQEIANDCIHAVLKEKCNDEQSYIKCWKNLFPKTSKFKKRFHFSLRNDNEYELSRVYHKYRRKYELSFSNLACIQYHFDENEENEESKNNSMSIETENENLSCDEHIDYTLISIILCNDSGLQVRNMHTFEWIDINEILINNGICCNDECKVAVVITGLTLGSLLHDRIACLHSVKKSYKSDRMSFPFFMYADPNGIIDSSLMKREAYIVAKKPEDVVQKVADLIAQNMEDSVNF